MFRRHAGSWRVKKSCTGFVWGGPGFSSAWERNRPYCQLPSVLMLRSVSAVVTLGIWLTISTFPWENQHRCHTLELYRLLLFSILTIKELNCFSFFSQLLQLPCFLAQMMGKTHTLLRGKPTFFLLCGLLEVTLLANPNWIMIFRRRRSRRDVCEWLPWWIGVIKSVFQGYQCKSHTLGNFNMPLLGCF